VAEGRVLPGGRGGAGVGGLVSAFVILASIRCARGYKSLNFMCNLYRLAIVLAINFDCPFLEGWIAVDYRCTVFKMGIPS
jgi:hypothetical protein